MDNVSDEHLKLIAKRMKEIFGDKIISAVHFPMQFEYYLKLFMYYHGNDPLN
jgi:hypothetical protein